MKKTHEEVLINLLKEIVEDLKNNYQNQHLFVISLLNQDQINDYIAGFNIE